MSDHHHTLVHHIHSDHHDSHGPDHPDSLQNIVKDFHERLHEAGHVVQHSHHHHHGKIHLTHSHAGSIPHS